MTVSKLIETILSVDFAFGAVSALAFQREMRKLYSAVFDKAESKVESDGKSP